MSILVLAVVGLLIVRHRKNIGRLLAGTENRVNFGRRKDQSPPQPAGKIHPAALVALAIAGVFLFGFATFAIRRSGAPVEIVAGPWRLREAHREATGQQRASRLAFNAEGDRLAVLCPRYNRVLVYRVNESAQLVRPVEIAVEGRPVAIAVFGGHVAVLQRPVNDAKHLGEGWIDAFTLDGVRVGVRAEAGYYPDDLAATPDGVHLLALASGRAEGDSSKHAPELTVHEVAAILGDGPVVPVGRLSFHDDDDLDRLTLSHLGSRALASLARKQEAVAIDLADPKTPRACGRMDLAQVDDPYVSPSVDGDWIVVPCREEREFVAMTSLPSGLDRSEPSGLDASYLVLARPDRSTLDLVQVAPPSLIGRFPILGPMNLAGAETAGVAYSERRRLLAAATKPGAVHLIQLESRLTEHSAPPPRVAAVR